MVTLQDVAKQAGVSLSTVSIVVNQRQVPGVSIGEATRRRVLATAEELGYQRHSSAQVMRTGRYRCVALLLAADCDRSNLPPRLLDGILDELAAHDLHLSLARLPDEKLTDEGVVPKMLREWMADGLLIDYTHRIPQRMIELIHSHHLPAIWINSQQEADCVYPHDREAAQGAVRHLVELGHRRITYADLTHAADDEAEHYSSRDRCAGYEAAMRAAHLPSQIMFNQGIAPEGRLSRVAHLLTAEHPTAVVCYGDVETELFILAATRLGLEVPRDLSVVTFGSPRHAGNGLPLTSLIVPEYEVGRAATWMLLGKIEHPQRVLPPRVIGFDFDAGATCAPPHS